MRIIAGTNKGRTLKAPKWDGLRPTSDKLRETLFNILQPRIEGARVLDVFAGTGAVALEALSRGAASATCVDSDRRAAGLIAENARALRRVGIAVLSSATSWSARCRSRFPAARSTSSCSIRRTITRISSDAVRDAATQRAAGGIVSRARVARRAAAAGRPGADADREVGRQRPDLLRMTHRHPDARRHLSRIVRSADQRPRRHHRARRADLRLDHRRHPGQRREDAAVQRERARRDHPRRLQGQAERAGRDLRRPAGRLRAAQEGHACWCAACAPCRISSTSSRWR